MKRWDIIIAGGGPAGLSLAANLSVDFSVLVIEKGKAGTTTRAWYTFGDRIKANGLDKAVVATPKSLTFYMDDEHAIFYKDNHALIDENYALRIFREKAEANGCDIMNNTSVIDFEYGNNNVIVKTNRGAYHGSLLIDCMGTTSPLVSRRNLRKDFNVWIVYGTRVRNTVFSDSDTIGFYKMPEKYQSKNDKTNYMFGIYPKSGSKGDVYLFNYYNRVLKPEILKNKFMRSVKEFLPPYKSSGILRGWIYNGTLHTYALDKVLFIGDAGALTPPAIGMGFNEILRKNKLISERIRHKINHQHDVSAHALGDILLDYRSSPSYSFLRICQKYFYYGNTTDEWKKGISILKKAGRVFTRKWMRNELDPYLIKKGMKSLVEVVGWAGLAKILPLDEYVKFSLDSMKIIGSSIIEDAHFIFHRQYGDKPSELCRFCKCKHATCY